MPLLLFPRGAKFALAGRFIFDGSSSDAFLLVVGGAQIGERGAALNRLFTGS
jgi:hypothetical protein